MPNWEDYKQGANRNRGGRGGGNMNAPWRQKKGAEDSKRGALQRRLGKHRLKSHGHQKGFEGGAG